MRKILLIAFILVCSISSNAQEHFTFRDIPIDGRVEQMGARLLELGYKSTEQPHFFTGKFIGEDCSIILLPSNYTQNICVVAINFESQIKWSHLKFEYERIKELYSEKYGKPVMSIQEFHYPFHEGDGYELYAIDREKCNYNTLWDLDNGRIMLFITEDCAIGLYYVDKINDTLDKQAKENVIKNEI